MKLHLTDMAIKKLSLPEGKQITYWDELTPGFGVRCSKKSKSFVVMYGERRQLKTLGRYPSLSLAEARTAARRFFVEFESGTAANPSVLFVQAKERFLEDSRGRNKPRTAADYERLLNRHFNFSGELRDVTRQQVMQVVSGLAETPSERSHAYVAIRTMMNWCVRHGLVDYSVVPTIKHGGEARNRFLTEAELKSVLTRAAETPYPFGAIIQLLIHTGQRRSDIGQLRWSWVFDDLIVFPEGFTKNKREHQIPVTPRVRAILKKIPSEGALVFPATTNTDKPFSGWAWHKARFDEGLDDVAPFTLHDLRRTFATIHAKIGTPIHVTEKLLNHVSGSISGVAAVYNRHSYIEEMRFAVKAYDDYLANLLGDC